MSANRRERVLVITVPGREGFTGSNAAHVLGNDDTEAWAQVVRLVPFVPAQATWEVVTDTTLRGAEASAA